MSQLFFIKKFAGAALLLCSVVNNGTLYGQSPSASAYKGWKDARFQLEWPPRLPDGKMVVSDVSPLFIQKPATANIAEGVLIAKIAPRIDFVYLPGQTYPGKLWSVWGDGTAVASKYYTSIGDHNAPRGEAQVYEYDARTKQIRLLISVRKYLEHSGRMPAGMDYTPGKIHGRVDMGSDGWLYFSTHRGSTNDNTTDKRGYKGDHIYRVNPVNGNIEIVATYPVSKHTIPASVLDPARMIFYGGTNPGNDAADKNINFIAYDVKNRKMLKQAPDGFDRYAIWSARTGCIYWKGAKKDRAKYNYDGGYKYDPATNQIQRVQNVPNVRASTRESSKGIVYGFTQDENNIWAFDTKTEKLTTVGPAMVGLHSYVTSVDLDPLTERYLYYVPGAHGGAEVDGTPVIQYDLKTKSRKIIAFMSVFYKEKYGFTPDGTFSSALSPDGSILYITWNGSRKSPVKGWNTVAVTAIHIPARERLP
ncbi:MAG: hypothetical protein EOO04_16260 [Chitinophagaceae bacterium]|nr:MAG: hypothetical protein EOO04_16260 [Chitinophagaceae bacterium]